ncbi:hypothetical protein SK128_025875, partial [Halocaridina rubra]
CPIPLDSTAEPVSVDDFIPDEGRLDQAFLSDIATTLTKDPTPPSVEEDSDDECDGNPMVSGIEVDLDPDDLNLGSNIAVVAEDPKDAEEDLEDFGFSVGIKRHSDKAPKSVSRTKPKSLRRKSSDSQNRDSDSDGVGNVPDFSMHNIQSLANGKQNLVPTSATLHPALAFSIETEKKESDAKKDEILDNWLSSEETTIANPYVSTSSAMPDGALADSDDEEEGSMTEICKDQGKINHYSCSTSRSDSPLESSERKKKNKKKDREKKEKFLFAIILELLTPEVLISAIPLQEDEKVNKKSKKKSKDKKEKESDGDKKKKKKRREKEKDDLEEFFGASPEKEFDEAYEAI